MQIRRRYSWALRKLLDKHLKLLIKKLNCNRIKNKQNENKQYSTSKGKTCFQKWKSKFVKIHLNNFNTRTLSKLHCINNILSIPRSKIDRLIYFIYVYVNSFFHPVARLWNSLHIECFPVIFDLQLTDTYYALIFLCLIFL